MADVFISYSRKNQTFAIELAKLLEDVGISTWWDASLVPVERFRDEITRQLDAAKAVVVLWSTDSIKSDFVVHEAEKGKEQGKLISLIIAALPASKIPLGFGTLHAGPIDDIDKLFSALGGLGVAPNRTISQYVSAIVSERLRSLQRKKRRAWPYVVAFLAALMPIIGFSFYQYESQLLERLEKRVAAVVTMPNPENIRVSIRNPLCFETGRVCDSSVSLYLHRFSFHFVASDLKTEASSAFKYSRALGFEFGNWSRHADIALSKFGEQLMTDLKKSAAFLVSCYEVSENVTSRVKNVRRLRQMGVDENRIKLQQVSEAEAVALNKAIECRFD